MSTRHVHGFHLLGVVVLAMLVVPMILFMAVLAAPAVLFFTPLLALFGLERGVEHEVERYHHHHPTPPLAPHPA